jgi:hypothetical protein
MTPHIHDKSRWPDVMHDQEWPMRQASLLFAGVAFGEADYIELWRTLRADSKSEEAIRNFFIRPCIHRTFSGVGPASGQA